MTIRWNMNHQDGSAPLAGVDVALSLARKRQRHAQYYYIVSIASRPLFRQRADVLNCLLKCAEVPI
jgi:hypothetical protein